MQGGGLYSTGGAGSTGTGSMGSAYGAGQYSGGAQQQPVQVAPAAQAYGLGASAMARPGPPGYGAAAAQQPQAQYGAGGAASQLAGRGKRAAKGRPPKILYAPAQLYLELACRACRTCLLACLLGPPVEASFHLPCTCMLRVCPHALGCSPYPLLTSTPLAPHARRRRGSHGRAWRGRGHGYGRARHGPGRGSRRRRRAEPLPAHRPQHGCGCRHDGDL